MVGISTASLVDNASMTSATCIEYCRALNHEYAAVKASHCVCHNQTITTKQDNWKCTFKCPGNVYQRCGGPGVFSLFWIGSFLCQGYAFIIRQPFMHKIKTKQFPKCDSIYSIYALYDENVTDVFYFQRNECHFTNEIAAFVSIGFCMT